MGARQCQREHTDGDVHGGTRERGLGVAQPLDEDEAGDRTAGDCAEGVDAVQQPDAQAGGAAGEGDMAGEQGQGGPHEEHGNEKQDEGHDRAQGHAAGAGEGEGTQGLDDRSLAVGDGDKEGGGPEANDNLEEAVCGKGPRGAVGQLASPQAARAETEEEDGEHGGHGLVRCAKEQHELARPYNLIEQAARAGEEEEQQHGRQRAPVAKEGAGVHGQLPGVHGTLWSAEACLCFRQGGLPP